MCARPNCGHPRAIHAGDACRIGGCPCEGFDDGKQRPAGPRRVSIDIPDGYSATIVLSPDYATGGPVGPFAGEPYLVGESGPETFVPNEPGVVIPNRTADS